jgi:hypothetical protein
MTPLTAQSRSERRLSCDEILRIAQQDAEVAYRDLDLRLFRISLALKENGWHVDYDLVAPGFAGGGPHYVIDPVTGSILWKTYEQ